MLNSFASLIPIVGVVGAGVSPIIYERVSAKNFTTSWNRKLEQNSYLLGSCQKQSNTKQYEIEFYLSNDDGGGENDRGLGLTAFVKANGQKLYGGWTLKGSEDGKAILEISPSLVDLSLAEEEWNDLNNECSMNSISSSGGSDHSIKEFDINFVCKEKSIGFGKKECDVQFAEGNKFAFKGDLKPKLKYSAFYNY